MITKEDLLKYAKQNPSKYAHKFGHVDVDSLPSEGYIDHLIKKATTNLDGTPSKSVQELQAELSTPAVVQKPVVELIKEVEQSTQPIFTQELKDEQPQETSASFEVLVPFNDNVSVGDKVELTESELAMLPDGTVARIQEQEVLPEVAVDTLEANTEQTNG